MGFFKPTAFLTGVATEGVNMFNKAEAIGEEGLENLKAAREEVNEEIKEVKTKYDKAIQVADNAGGGAFAKYLINTRGYDYLADLSTATEESLQEELGSLKTKFNSLDEKEKARFSDGDFSESVKSDYDREVEAMKVNSGLVNTNNLGVATANTLGGKVQAMVDRQYEPRRQAIIDTVSGGALRESKPTAGGFDAIATISAVNPFLSLNYEDARPYNNDYQKWYESSFKDIEGEINVGEVNARIQSALETNGYDIRVDDNSNRIDENKVNNILNYIATQENVDIEGAKTEILRESYFDEFYPKGSYGNGYLAQRRIDRAAGAGQTDTNTIRVTDNFENLDYEGQIEAITLAVREQFNEEISREDAIELLEDMKL